MPLLWAIEPNTVCQTSQGAGVAGAVQAVQPALGARFGEQDRQVFELVRHGWHHGAVAAAVSSEFRSETSGEGAR